MKVSNGTGMPLGVLIIEDSVDDAALLVRELKRSGYDVTSERVDTQEDLSASLERQAWDIIISDYQMPRFQGTKAFAVVKEKGIDIPFIFVSGAMGEDIAVEAMRAGAHDYIMKDNLKRLVPAIERELREAKIRREKSLTENIQNTTYRISEAVSTSKSLEDLFRSIHDIIGLLIPAQNFHIALYDPGTQLLSFPYFVSERRSKPFPRSLGKGLIEYVIRTRQPLFAPMDRISELAQKGEIDPLDEPLTAWLGVPLALEGGGLGVLAVQSYSGSVQFGEREQDMLIYVSEQIAMAIERKRTENALRESEEQFRFLSDATFEGVGISQQGKIFLANRALADILGCAPNELVGKSIMDFVAPDDRKLVMDGIISGGGQHYEHRALKKDGTEIFVEVRSRAIQYRGQQCRMTAVRDVTESNRLRKVQNALYRIAHASDLSPTLDELFHRIHEIIQEVMPAKNFFIAFYDERDDILSFPYFVDEFDEPVQPAKPGKGLTEYVLRTAKSLLCDSKVDQELQRLGEVDLVGVDSSIWLGVPLIIEGKSIGVMAVQHYTDPSAYGVREQQMLEFVSSEIARAIDHKRTEEGLAYERELWRALTDNIPDTIYFKDLDSRFTNINNAQAHILGINHPREAIGKTDFDFFNKSHAEQAFADEQSIIRTGEPVVNKIEFVHSMKGEEYWVSATKLPLRDKSGRTIGTMGSSRDITQLKRAEDDLRETNEKLRTMVQASPLAIIALDAGDNVISWSPAAERIFGWAEGEVLGKFIPTVPDEKREDFRKYCTWIREGNTVRSYEAKRLRRDGSTIEVTITGGPLSDGRGNIRGTIAIIEDATEKKRSERALNSLMAATATVVSTDYFPAFVEHLASLLQVRCVFVTELLDGSSDKVRTLSVWKDGGLIEDFEYVLPRTPCEAVVKEGKASFYPDRVDELFPNDRLFAKWGIRSYIGTPLIGASGQAVGHICILHDKPMKEEQHITAILNIFASRAAVELERKRVEEALKESEERYRALAENSPDGIVVSIQDKVVYVNPAAFRIMGIDPLHPVLGVSLDGFIRKEDRELLKKRRIAMVETQEPAPPAEWKMVRSDGVEIEVEGMGVPIVFGGRPGVLSTFRDITERKRAVSALEEGRKRLITLAEISPAGIFRTDPQGHTVYVNPKWSEISGMAASEALGEGWRNAIHPEDRNRLTTAWEQVAGAHQPSAEEYRFLRPDGSTSWVIGYAVPEQDNDGNFLGYVGTITDITARKQIEDALKESEERYRALAENSPDGIIVAHEDKLVYVNSAAVRAMKAESAEQLLGMSIFNFIQEDMIPLAVERRKWVLQYQAAAPPAEFKLHRLDGSLLEVEGLGVPILFGGKPAILNSFRDITDRKAAEVALRESQERFRELMKQSPIAMGVANDDGTIEYLNDRFIETFGYTREDLPDLEAWWPRAYPDQQYRQQVLEEWQNVLDRSRKTGREIEPRETRVHCKDGSERAVIILGKKIGNKNLEIFDDITERRRIEEALQESEQRYQILFESANDAIFLMRDDRFVECNDKTLEVFGCGRERIVGTTPYDFSPPYQADGNTSKAKALDKLAAVIEGRPQVFDWMHIRADGTPFDAEVSLNRVELGSKLYVQAIVRDITERKLAEAALKEQILFDSIMTKTLTEFATCTLGEIDYTITASLQAFAEFIGIDDAFVIIISDDQKTWSVTHQWCAPGIPLHIEHFQNIEVSSVPWVSNRVLAGEIIRISSLDDYPPEAKIARTRIEKIGGKSTLQVPIAGTSQRVSGVVGLISHARAIEWLDSHVARLKMVGDAIASLIERKRAEEELQKLNGQLRTLVVRLETIQEDVSKRISREIHDELGQELTGLKIDLVTFSKKLRKDQTVLHDEVRAMSRMIDGIMLTVHKISTELRPGILDDLGLVPAIEWQAGEFQKRTGIACAVDLPTDDVSIDSTRRISIYRILLESLTNVARHAQAKNVKIFLRERKGSIRLEVSDDGKGILPQELSDSKSIGLVGMRERANMIDATLEISGSPGNGTKVTLNAPIQNSKKQG